MPTMVTFRGGRAARGVLCTAFVVLGAAGCSREQQDWRAAESAGTSEAYGVFIEQHPDSELTRQARARIAQVAEDRDWQRATGVATLAAYQQFLAQHPAGHWSEQARIRIEGFSLGSAPHMAPESAGEASPLQGSTGVKMLQLAAASGPPADAAGVPVAAAAPGQAETPAVPTSVPPAASETAARLRLAVASAAAPAANGAVMAAGNEPLVSASDGTVTAAASTVGYSVQLGAFGSEASAGAEWARLHTRFSAQLGGLSPHIVAATTPAGRLYRLQAATDDEAQARAICASLKEQWQACMAVPRNPLPPSISDTR